MENLIKWRKASRSANDGSHCVELADLGAAVGVRDSKAPEAGHLVVDRASLASLVAIVKAS
ncbi:DUF397 domain-containing protein [Actinomadura parmotrematis]|uniref:DUF397 domain-containing protein n=1 Tax=Actinomadura parmotrematis TaxID=2864039 RepID=A0ABS7FVS2_9ACTN|nr:DUF397 domain-containing protein [Actinomadura parmotrematis]MBW8484376.1 DUF397 domain-containing protein [Actinomadura parmotrematis]